MCSLKVLRKLRPARQSAYGCSAYWVPRGPVPGRRSLMRFRVPSAPISIGVPLCGSAMRFRVGAGVGGRYAELFRFCFSEPPNLHGNLPHGDLIYWSWSALSGSHSFGWNRVSGNGFVLDFEKCTRFCVFRTAYISRGYAVRGTAYSKTPYKTGT